MSFSKSKKLLGAASEHKIEFTADEKILALIYDNTNGHDKYADNRVANNIYRCLALVAGGTSRATACKLTGIHRRTFDRWRDKEWFSQAIDLIRKQLDDQLDGKMTKVINKTIDKLYDRIDTGDAVVQRNGELVYKPVTAKDAAIISSIFFDKRNLLRNKPTSITSTQSTNEHLQTLASRFREIAIDVTDYEEIDTQAPQIEHKEATPNPFTFNEACIKEGVQS